MDILERVFNGDVPTTRQAVYTTDAPTSVHMIDISREGGGADYELVTVYLAGTRLFNVHLASPGHASWSGAHDMNPEEDIELESTAAEFTGIISVVRTT